MLDLNTKFYIDFIVLVKVKVILTFIIIIFN